MPDREHRTMNRVKTTSAQPARTTLAANTGALKLLERDNAVLPCRNPGYDDIRAGLGTFCMHGDA
jgi:hypothetical protein